MIWKSLFLLLGLLLGSSASFAQTGAPEAKQPVPAPAKRPANSEFEMPVTTRMPESKDIPGMDPLLATPPLPKGMVSLVGGTVKDVDQIRNKMSVAVYGGGKMNLRFDERSHFYKDGVETTQLAVKKGDRVYVDTQLAEGKIFARSVRVQSEAGAALASGQVISFRPKSGELVLRESLSARPLIFQVARGTEIKREGQPGNIGDVRPNSIVSIVFMPVPGRRANLKEINVLAVPGTKFTFAGKLTHLDLRSGVLALENASDGKLYEVKFKPTPQVVTDDLVIGAEVSIVALFSGRDYIAESLAVTSSAQARPSEDELK